MRQPDDSGLIEMGKRVEHEDGIRYRIDRDRIETATPLLNGQGMILTPTLIVINVEPSVEEQSWSWAPALQKAEPGRSTFSTTAPSQRGT